MWDSCYEEWTAETSLTYHAPGPVPNNVKHIGVRTHKAPPSLHKITALCLSKSYTCLREHMENYSILWKPKEVDSIACEGMDLLAGLEQVGISLEASRRRCNSD